MVSLIIQNISLNTTILEWRLKKYGKSEEHTIKGFLIDITKGKDENNKKD